jgi:hypothetical protein
MPGQQGMNVNMQMGNPGAGQQPMPGMNIQMNIKTSGDFSNMPTEPGF